jgi:hypothetical protein
MNPRFSPRPFALLMLGLLLITRPLHGAELIEDVQVGIGGKLKLGHWTAVQVQLQSPVTLQGQVEVTVQDGDATDAVFRGPSEVSLEAGKPQTVTIYVRFGQQKSGLEVVFRDPGGQLLCSRRFVTPRAMLSTDYWILTVGAEIPANQALLKRSLAPDDGQHLIVGHLSSMADLPDQWIGLGGIDQLVLTTSRQEYTGGDRLAVLSRWVHMGGRLVISVGTRAETLLAGESGWNELVPGTYTGTVRQWQTGGLEVFAGANQRLLLSAPGDSPMTLLTDVTGVLESLDGVGGTGDRPMIVRAAQGLGQVVFLAVDLDRSPVDGWSSFDRLLEGLLSRRTDVASGRSAGGGSAKVAHVGYDDLAGQLRAALDRFSGVAIVSFYWVVAILVVYILFLGPVDYFLLKRFHRQHWTWVTLPLMATLCAVLVLSMSNRLKPDQVLVNHLEIVDLDLASQHLRATSWIHLYSPRARTFDLSLDWDGLSPLAPAGNQDWQQRLSWQGLPGEGLGGLDTGGGNTINQSYGHGSVGTGELHGLPMMAASTRSLVATAAGSHQLEVTSELSPDNITGALEGSFSNPLGVAILEGVLYYGDWAFELPARLEPGETVRALDLRETMRNLESRLTKSRVVKRSQQESGWSKVDLDVPRIVEMLMFHQAAGGARYTGLTHRYQPWLDMSDHLNLNRAVLVGRVAAGASRLAVGGELKEPDQQWVYYRIVFPVSPATGG